MQKRLEVSSPLSDDSGYPPVTDERIIFMNESITGVKGGSDKAGSFTRGIQIMPSMCDRNSRLTVPYALDIFQNNATLHAEALGIGPGRMNRSGYFWIITRMRIHINRLPKLLDRVDSNTWIQPAERVSCERDFSMTQGEEVLVYGRSMWAVLSRENGKLVHLDELYPDADFSIAPPDDRPFVRLGRSFDNSAELGSYRIRSIDIDTGGHMNNVNYIRAMLGCFGAEELEELRISELEVNFMHQSYEGETLRFVRRSTDRGMEIGALKEDGSTAFTALLH